MSKVFHFLAGFPRSGGTLLSNLLAQNPRFDSVTQGGILSALQLVRSEWNRNIAFRATPNESGKNRVLRKMFETYHSATDRPVVFDRSLGWLGSLELAEQVLGHRPKVLVNVRDVRDVLSAFEVQWQTQPAMREFIAKQPSAAQWETVQGRCAIWVGGEEPIGIIYNQIKDALAREFKDCLYFVRFEELMTKPREVFAAIYDFLEEPFFEHKFDGIEQIVWDTYSLYGVPEMNYIPAKLAPVPPLWPDMLGPVAEKYAEARIW